MKKNDISLYKYFQNWIHIYKKGSIRKISFNKYLSTLDWIIKICPEMRLCDLNRINYQTILNEYAEYHERQTTMDFHHHLKSCILDAFDEGLIENDPTRKVVIKGCIPSRNKKPKFLSQFELQLLIKNLKLKNQINFDWLILLIAKTGLRFSEALALTPADFDFNKQILNVSKTWDYKDGAGFAPTKNRSSIRKVQLDWLTISQFAMLIKDLPPDEPFFVKGKRIFNSTINDILERRCKKANIPVISVHGLRHTHASILLYAGVSIASVAKRLGHASMNTTERVYLHIINELENKDIDLVMRSISSLF
ncbi:MULTISPECIES: site-specific integrase [Ureaplasma]|uniref:Site-specific integrase n=1 Tax=Ureaplasma zalophigenitalium TaxID=907723 RepID=A0ABT3BP87_9BACT|nr:MULTISPECIES: site-specific integrase [Ureaplasma]MCV3734545.1 site-specific integrase [Ureaplasma miroungigenitalium]MCV3754049.1 site-specific integrase [Ureaplasma zalophigenitalium]